MAAYRIWLIEQDETIAGLLTAHLMKHGFETVWCTDFERINKEFITVNPHLILMDVKLPKDDGFLWCKRLRRLTKNPIVFICHENMDYDELYAMECGGDDYVVPPFSYHEIIGKIDAQLKRCFGEHRIDDNHRMICGDCILHPATMELQCKGARINLTQNLLKLFQCVFDAFPHYVKGQRLLDILWDEHCFIEENTLEVNVEQARKCLRDLDSQFHIQAVQGRGYRIEEGSDEADKDD